MGLWNSRWKIPLEGESAFMSGLLSHIVSDQIVGARSRPFADGAEIGSTTVYLRSKAALGSFLGWNLLCLILFAWASTRAMPLPVLVNWMGLIAFMAVCLSGSLPWWRRYRFERVTIDEEGVTLECDGQFRNVQWHRLRFFLVPRRGHPSYVLADDRGAIHFRLRDRDPKLHEKLIAGAAKSREQGVVVCLTETVELD